MENKLTDSYNKIRNDVLGYVPSKLLVVFNFLFIIPLLAHVFNETEMSYYFLCIQFLNIMCTCSSDWITKSIIRFHEKYKIHGLLDDFYSSILWLILFTNLILSVIFISCHSIIYEHFNLNLTLCLQTLFIVLPCGIRQLLFQFLRVTDRCVLYTAAIVIYQIILIFLIVTFCKYNTHAYSIILSMNIAMFLVDIFMIKNVKLDYKIKFKVNKDMLFEFTKYSLPLLITNVSYWLTLHFSKLYFQNQSQFLYTAIVGFCMMLVTYIISSIASTFNFACFPVIVKKYEYKEQLKAYWTKTLQLYVLYILPMVMVFCCFFNEITVIMLPSKYHIGSITLPFFALSVFLHEFLKLITVKYHLNNSTYTETIISIFVLVISLILNVVLMQHYGILGAAVALFITESLFLILNTSISIKNLDYISFSQIFKTSAIVFLIGLVIFLIITCIFNYITLFSNTLAENIIKVALYICAYYAVCLIAKNKFLNYKTIDNNM